MIQNSPQDEIIDKPCALEFYETFFKQKTGAEISNVIQSANIQSNSFEQQLDQKIKDWVKERCNSDI